MAHTAKRLLFPAASWALLVAGNAARAEPSAGAGSPASLGSLAEVLFSLVLVLGAIVLAGWVLRRLRAPMRLPQGTLRALGAFPLGPRERVVLLQVGGTQLLVGVAPGGMRTLHVLDEPVEPRNAAPGGGFAERLRAMMKREDAA